MGRPTGLSPHTATCAHFVRLSNPDLQRGYSPHRQFGPIKKPSCEGVFMGRPTGFEPATTGITIQDSTAELRPPLIVTCSFHAYCSRASGAPDRTRTCYPRLRRPVLYPDELRAHCCNPNDKPAEAGLTFFLQFSKYLSVLNRKVNGRGGGIRTHDPLLPKQMR
jgi:hypothetical protein